VYSKRGWHADNTTAYDEEDGDFVFTRGSKKAKTAPTAMEPIPEPEPVPSTSTKRGRRPKERDDEAENSENKSRTRAMNFSTPKTPNDSIVNPKQRKTTRSSAGKLPNDKRTANTSTSEATDYDSVDLVGSTVVNDTANGISDSSNQPTIIALPFSDTPVINRNKEMRKQNKGTRRSSLGLRGRRASSLIENGHSAIPHREVEASEFYKHIEADGLSEPRRMKQLLTWTGERELGEKPSHGEANDLSEQAGMLSKSQLELLMLIYHRSSHY
jgi:kinetochore protein Mis13/DSN1